MSIRSETVHYLGDLERPATATELSHPHPVLWGGHHVGNASTRRGALTVVRNIPVESFERRTARLCERIDEYGKTDGLAWFCGAALR